MKTLLQRLEQMALELSKIKALERHRRKVCGTQRAKDHDHSARWQLKRLPTYNP